MQSINQLFTEKYRPKNLEELILPERVMNKFKDGLVQNMLFAGSPGTGKTSTAKALVNQFELPYLYINASTDTSVDVIRTKIIDFCSTVSIIDKAGMFKVVILDEVDGVSDQFFKALRATMEQFASNSRFIATCNYINKVPDPVLSRFELIDFDFDKEEETELTKKYIKRVYEICGKEGMTIEKPALVEFVRRNFPDLRSTLNKLQGYKTQGNTNITAEDVKKFNSVYKDVFELIFNETDPAKNYQLLVSNYANKVDDILQTLGEEFIEYIQQEKTVSIKHIPQIIITVAKHQAQRVHVIDPVITMLSCVYEIQSIINA
ncbi:AAA family ATPase [bacterium]|jgi:DNA polymerase III delta prime subunit|nr:AAA family ATPase [bacterium]MDB9900023.1 AAA family ATPase [bacterium]|tara:strand:- start:4157 stop:5113 length:957 start_codon:yes stop_codon:yes gene_type:complete